MTYIFFELEFRSVLSILFLISRASADREAIPSLPSIFLKCFQSDNHLESSCLQLCTSFSRRVTRVSRQEERVAQLSVLSILELEIT